MQIPPDLWGKFKLRYVGAFFPPLNLLGLLFRGSPVLAGIPSSEISVIVPAYNAEKTLRRAVECIENQSKLPYKVYLIDDASQDLTPVIAGELKAKYSNIEVLRNDVNLGKAQSLNRVLNRIKTPFLAIVDSDTYLEEDYFHKTIRGFYEKDVVISSGLVLPSFEGGIYERGRLIEYLLGQNTYKILQEKIGGIWVSAGCCSVFRTKWLREKGIPSDTIVEDMDLTWEAQVNKKKVAFIPDAISYTDEPKTWESYKKQIERWFSWRPVVEKHISRLSRSLMVILLWVIGESLGFLVWLGVVLYFSLFKNGYSVLSLILSDLALVSGITLYYGKKLGIALTSILKAIPVFYLLRIPNTFTFWKRLIVPKRKGW